MDQQREQYGRLLRELPLHTIDYAFAYGSGALQQKGEKKEDKMVDFIISTSDPEAFHRENLERNPKHYSLLRVLGPKIITKFQNSFGAHVYFNTQVAVDNRTIKYGVISMQDLKADLLDWKWLYVAGRLHKPVLEVVSKSTAVDVWVTQNRRNALHVALLQSKETFKMRDLLEKIVAISYTGDFRMIVGEDRNKIAKIVDGSYDELTETYRHLLEKDKSILVKSDESCQQDCSILAIKNRLSYLPLTVKQQLPISQLNPKEMKSQNDLPEQLSAAIKTIVAPIALMQTAKNAVSAGIMRSIVYSMAKMGKMLKSIK